MGKNCSVCHMGFDGEDAAVLAFGGYGTPRYLCDFCAKDFDAAMTEREVEGIDGAIDRISKKMTNAGIDDEIVLKSVDEIMKAARERREKIRAGEYDFSEDESVSEGDEIPAELLESEEDAEAEKQESKKDKLYDKITNIVCAALSVAALVFIVYQIINAYFI